MTPDNSRHALILWPNVQAAYNGRKNRFAKGSRSAPINVGGIAPGRYQIQRILSKGTISSVFPRFT